MTKHDGDEFEVQEDHTEEIEPSLSIDSPLDINTLSQKIDTLQKNILTVTDILKQRLSYDQTKEKAFEYLYSELDSLKRNQNFEDNKNLFADLILFFDRLEQYGQQNENSNHNEFTSLKEELLEIFGRRDIEQINAGDNSFSSSLQQAITTKIVDSAENDKRVIRVLRQGFTHHDKVIRPQEVILGRYKKEDTTQNKEDCDE